MTMLHVLSSVSFLVIAFVASTPIEDAAKVACPANEHYISCALAHCQPESCSDLGKGVTCPRPVRLPCEGGCVCNYGHVRDDTGACVPEEKCPSATCPSKEFYVTCLPGKCLPKYCKDIGRPIACASYSGYCPGGCLCSEGYLRNEGGLCIKKEMCNEYKKDTDIN